MGAECSGCGACCCPVVLPNTQLEFARARGIHPRTREWLLKDLTPMPRKEAKQIAPWAFNPASSALLGMENIMPFFFRCRWFDEETRLCTNYENRPKPCSDFPWGDRPPRPNAGLPPMCAYREDIGKPVQPMPPEWQKILLTRKK